MTFDTSFQRAPNAPSLPTTPFHFIVYFVAKYRWVYLAMVLAETIYASAGIMIPYATSHIIKSVVASGAHTDQLLSALRQPFLLFFAFSVAEVLFGRLAGFIQMRLGPRQRQTVTRAVYQYLQYHSHRYFSDNFAGSLAHRISETSMGVTQTLNSLITEFWPILITMLVAVCLLFHANHGMAAFVGLWSVVFIGISYWLARRCQPHAYKAAAARSETTGKVVDSVTNLSTARLFARLPFEREFLDTYMTQEMLAIRNSHRFAERVRWFQQVSSAVLKVGTLSFALYLWCHHQIGVGEFVMAVSMSLIIVNEARNLGRRFLELFEYIGNVANGVHTIVRAHEVVDADTASIANITQGRIEFRDVSFGYEPNRLVFRDLNLLIPAGQRVGLVGFSGSGKSTFVSTVLRLYDLNGGQILIDGEDNHEVTQDSLHAQIGLIPQDPQLFHRTLRENIRYGRLEASDEEVEDAARKAHAHEFIIDMPLGYDSMVGERGVKLSGGQRQRIAIARVILKNAPILILDEATSSLDSITEKTIQETLDEVMRGKTVLVVAHRLSTIAHLDRILVFDTGRIVEDGSHAELLAQRGAYFRLWSRQSDGFLPEVPVDDYPEGNVQLAADGEQTRSKATVSASA